MADENVQVQRVTLLESDLSKTVLKGWLSSRTSFVVTIEGPFGEKEGAALLRLLGAQMDVLADGVQEGRKP